MKVRSGQVNHIHRRGKTRLDDSEVSWCMHARMVSWQMASGGEETDSGPGSPVCCSRSSQMVEGARGAAAGPAAGTAEEGEGVGLEHLRGPAS